MDNFAFDKPTNRVRITGTLVDYPTVYYTSVVHNTNYYLFFVNVSGSKRSPNLIPVIVSETHKDEIMNEAKIGDNIIVYGSYKTQRLNGDKYSSYVVYQKLYLNKFLPEFSDICLITGKVKANLMPISLPSGHSISTMLVNYGRIYHESAVKVSVSESMAKKLNWVKQEEDVYCRASLLSASQKHLALHIKAKLVASQEEMDNNPQFKQKFYDLDSSHYELNKLLSR